MNNAANDLEGNGFISNIYNLLWRKDPLIGVVPKLQIPDTIIYKQDKPITWFFTHEERLKKKTKSKTNPETIYSIFKRNVEKSGIAAFWVYKTIEESKEGLQQKENFVFEYLNLEDLHKFLFQKREKAKNGTLQRFIQPDGSHNFVVRAIWSPNLCLFDRVENLHKIEDKKKDIYQRVITIEDQKAHTKTTPLRGYILPHMIEKDVANIVKHIANVTNDYYKINRIILNFKTDPKGRIWLLFASSIRVEDVSGKGQSANKNENFIDNPLIGTKLPDFIENSKMSQLVNHDLRKIYTCLKCNDNIDKSSIYTIKYKQIIAGMEFEHNQRVLNNDKSISPMEYMVGINQSLTTRKNISQDMFNKDFLPTGQSKQLPFNPNMMHEIKRNYEIPKMISALHPRMKVAEFLELKKNPGFMDKNAIVCEDCYLEIITYDNYIESLPNIIKKNNMHQDGIIGLWGKPNDLRYYINQDKNFAKKRATSLLRDSRKTLNDNKFSIAKNTASEFFKRRMISEASADALVLKTSEGDNNQTSGDLTSSTKIRSKLASTDGFSRSETNFLKMPSKHLKMYFGKTKKSSPMKASTLTERFLSNNMIVDHPKGRYLKNFNSPIDECDSLFATEFKIKQFDGGHRFHTKTDIPYLLKTQSNKLLTAPDL